MLNYLYGLATDKEKGFIAGIIKVFLLILSFVYGLIVRILALARGFSRYRLDCRVISVGNITLGGTGKTPLVEYIANYLKSEGHKVAILSRGYKGLGSRPNTEVIGDEPYMLRLNLKDVPVIVDSDRVRAAVAAIRDYKADTVILDDGFQQWRIRKDLEIVAVDCASAFGNRHMLPRGILREPLSSLKRADVFVLTKVNLNPAMQDIKDFLSRINPSALLMESAHSPLGFCRLGESSPLLEPGALKGKTVTLFSGIGDPDSFENLIRGLDVNIGLSFRFPDHHNYSQKDLENIIEASRKKSIDTLITTEKDAARLCGYRRSLLGSRLPAAARLPDGQGQAGCSALGFRFMVLRIELKIVSNEERFRNRLLSLYSV